MPIMVCIFPAIKVGVVATASPLSYSIREQIANEEMI